MKRQRKIFASPHRTEWNPYTEEFYRLFKEYDYSVEEYSFHAGKKEKNQFVHYHWPEYSIFRSSKWETIWAALVFYFQLAYLRYICGHTIIWTCHNVLPHARNPSKAKIFMKPLALLCQKVIYLSEKNKNLAESVFPSLIKTDSCVIRLGIYPVEQQSKKAFGNGGIRFLTFGLIRKYKGIDTLIKAFNDWCAAEESSTATLKIIGNCVDEEVDYKTQLRELASKNEKVDLRFEFVSEDELIQQIDQCDAAIFAFRKVVNSSSAIRALSQGKRVVAPRMGSLIELQLDFGNELVFLFDELNLQTFTEVVKWLELNAEVKFPEIYQPRYITEQIDRFLDD
jgi:beta-1,4-mannosyltransferase